MNLNDLETILNRIRKKPKSTLLILTILVLIIVVGSTLTSYLEEKGKQLASSQSQEIERQEKSGLIFSRITLPSKNIYWEKVSRNKPNGFDELFVSMNETEVLKRECPGYFLSEMWCKESELFFSQVDLQDEAIDPSFDIVVENKSETPVTLLAVGVEIVHAFHETYSFGEWESTKVVIEGKYEVQMPSPPMSVKLENGDIVDVGKVRAQKKIDLEMSLADMRIESLLQVTYWEWEGLPIFTEKELLDPIYMKPNTPYRYLMALKQYKNMPNNVVLRFWIKTSEGMQKSSHVYLLAI